MENPKKGVGPEVTILIAIISIFLMLFGASAGKIIIRDIYNAFNKTDNVEQLVESMQNSLDDITGAEADVYYESETDTIFVSMTMDIDFSESVKKAQAREPLFRKEWDETVLPNMLEFNDALILWLKESNLEEVNLTFTVWNDVNSNFKILEIKNGEVKYDATKKDRIPLLPKPSFYVKKD